jgi:hypothetical protein
MDFKEVQPKDILDPGSPVPTQVDKGGGMVEE